MAQIFFDPEKTLEFVGNMKNYRENVQEETNGLRLRFDELKDSWNDQQRAKFEETFAELMNALQRFENDMEEQEPYLQELARIAEEYLAQQGR